MRNSHKQDGLAAPVLDLVDRPCDETVCMMVIEREERGVEKMENETNGEKVFQKKKRNPKKKILAHRCAMFAENSGFSKTWNPAHELESSSPLACLS